MLIVRKNWLYVCLGILLLAGCSKIGDIKVTSCGLESFSLKGFRSASAVLAVGIDNPAFDFTVTGLNGLVKYRGEDFASYSADTLAVLGKSSRVYDLPCALTLGDNVSVGKALSLLAGRSLEGFTTDIEARVRLKNGLAKTLHFNNIDLNSLAE